MSTINKKNVLAVGYTMSQDIHTTGVIQGLPNVLEWVVNSQVHARPVLRTQGHSFCQCYMRCAQHVWNGFVGLRVPLTC